VVLRGHPILKCSSFHEGRLVFERYLLAMNETDWITLNEASKLCPGRPSHSTMWRWASKGVKVGSRRVRLGHGFQGRNMVTTRAWVSEFTRACARTVHEEKKITPVAFADADEACVLEGI